MSDKEVQEDWAQEKPSQTIPGNTNQRKYFKKINKLPSQIYIGRKWKKII